MSPGARRGRYTLIVALLIFAALAGASLYISSKAARLVSGALTDALGQPVSVSLVGFSPASGLTLYGLTIKNPNGFKSPYLLNIRSLNLMPQYSELKHGRLIFRSLRVSSPVLYLEKDGSGRWNFQPMAEKLAKGKPRRFTLSETRISSGKLFLVDQGAAVTLPDMRLGPLSSIDPQPTPFNLTAKDEKGSTVTCEGEAGIMTKSKTLRARLAFKGEKLDRYLKPPKGLDLHDSSLQAALDFSYNGNLLTARLEGRLSGVRTAYLKEKGGLDARFTADVGYRPDAGTLDIRSAGLDVPGVTKITASGAVTDAARDPALDLTVNPSPVELARLKPYLPADMKADGVVLLGPVTIKGKLRPLTASATGRLGLSKSVVTYKGASLKAERGSVTVSVSSGLLRAAFKGSNFSLHAKELGVSAGSLDIAYSGGSARAVLSGIDAHYGKDATIKGAEATTDVTLQGGGRPLKTAGSFKIPNGEGWGASLAALSGNFKYIDGAAGLEVSGQALGNPVTLSAGASIAATQGLKNPYLSGKITVTQAKSLTPLLANRGIALSLASGALSAEVSFKGDSLDRLAGGAVVRTAGLGLDTGGKPLLRDLSCELRPVYEAGALSLPESAVSFGGSFKVAVSGRAARDDKGWSGTLTAKLPDTPLPSLQEGLLDALPPTLKWADVGGSAAADVGLGLSTRAFNGGGTEVKLTGSLTLKGATLSIPDQKVTMGPADGTVPLGFSFGGQGRKTAPAPFRQEPFERADFPRLIKKYSARPAGVNFTIRKAAFGLFEADDIEMALVPGDGWYQVDWLGLKCFGANAYGYALADFTGTKGPRYALSLLLSDFSLAELCRRVPGINGYLSGRVDGIARLFASGAGYTGVAGAASFWCHEAPGEDMVISKAFLKRLMGKSGQTYMLMGDRSFDTGEMDAIFSGGYIVFDRLLISHTNFLGMQDLKVSVAPISNKVAIEHLLEVMKDVSERAGTIK